MELRELRVVAFEHLIIFHQFMSTEGFEDLDDPGRSWSFAGPILWVERQLSEVGVAHRAAKFTLDQGMNEDGNVTEKRERIDALIGFQVDRDKVDDPLQHMVAVLDTGLALVDSEEVGLGHLGVVRHERPAAVEASVIAHDVVRDDRGDGVTLLLDAYVGGVRTGASALLLLVVHYRLGGDVCLHPARSSRSFDRSFGRGLHRRLIL